MDWNNPAIIWFIIGLVLFLLELAVPGLVLMFFGMGAWLTALLFLVFGFSIDVQLMVFILSSVLFLVTLRKYVNKLFSGKKQTEINKGENQEDYIGETVIVVETISPPKKGKVELHGTYWNADADNEIKAGSTVEIISKESLTLKVKTV
ncbi:MAG: NfeD family protein [Ignavibacteriales bacterium]|nr:NfeD family protein [Ignavibacteriales bacterium]